MSDPFEDFYDEIENLDSAVSKFIHPREFGERWDGTWAYFAFSYERAFEQLAKKAYEDGQGACTSLSRCSFWRGIQLSWR
ncbi:hypothetical protein IVB18_24175 [Bradyrhizobium sp. 186]|uniref:hypothetical protein n=1 Tax=Bradyrhizobium sp. 186 TaxID=2782654 RepID=UPI0020013AEF|nr:hypothetical protein [Bradyrhizobium sp. 186]UPK40051.1 hypothetical protein IVB18_24175 [Bradyrhizobium sp. 186]